MCMAVELHAQGVKKEMEHKIFVAVQGGVAEVCEETVPAGIAVEILDFDMRVKPQSGLPVQMENQQEQRSRRSE